MMAIAVHAPELRMVAADNDMIADLDLIQGMWTREQYLCLTDSSNRLLEFIEGRLEVLPMPTRRHQAILGFLYVAFLMFLQPRGGAVFFAPLRLQIRAGNFREPDLLLLRDAQDGRGENAYWLGADLVLEVVSPDNPERDIVEKPTDYAAAGIPEYWIVNPMDETITVLRLAAGVYVAHGVFRRGDTATSASLTGFSVAVNDVFDAR